MNVYAFSDPHFDSARIIGYGERPFRTVAEMNRRIIKNYNAVVGKNDVCYWLGDIMYDASQDKVRHVLSQMRGRKFLIMGNHDRSHSETWWKNAGFDKVFPNPVYLAEHYIMLSHEPLEELQNVSPIVNYHGHIHIQDYDFPNHQNYINVCVEKTDYKPVQIQNPLIKVPREFSR